MDIDADSESCKREQIQNALREYFGESHYLNIATFKTESSRSAVLTCCRGMGIPLEEAQALSDTIPNIRGGNYTIIECLEGGKDKDPIPMFKKLISRYDGLQEACLKIEGLVSGLGIHASGVAITNEPYINQVSSMVAPSGVSVTAFDLGDCEKAGIIKYDMLTVSTLDEIHTTLDLLAENHKIQWQGNLRDTYNKYLHPDNLDYSTKEMFEMLGTQKANNIFQLSTDMSMQACKLLAPKSLMEMTLVNSVIRLAGEQGKESPTQQYVRYKNDISEWYKDMREFQLSDDEIKVLENHLLISSGLCLSQETLMLMAMDEKISGMTLAETEVLRKGLSKKKQKLIEQSKETFYKRGAEHNVREKFLDYVWTQQFALSLSYSFALSHGVAYSCIGLQQLNLLYHFAAIYSYCATLLVNSSSAENSKSNKKDYGKIAVSIAQVKNQGVTISPCLVSKSKLGFSPNEEQNRIYVGLKNITNINNDLADKIISLRPYDSIEDFLLKVQPTKVQMFSLIKAGAFDEFNENRINVMKSYIRYTIISENNLKDKLTGANLNKIKEMNILPEEYDLYVRFYNFNKYITDKQFIFKKEGRKTFLIASGIAFNFFEQYYASEMTENADYYYTKDGIIFNKTAYNKIYKARLDKIIDFVNTKEFLEKYNSMFIDEKESELWDKYCLGTEKDWEFDSYNFYIGEHALINVNMDKYNLSEFNKLPEQPLIEEEYEYKGRTCYKYKLARLCGVVLDSDRTKHTVTLLTNKNEVVKAKYYSGQFINYNSQIKEEVDGKKIIKEKSWFTRGTLLVLVGYRNGDIFKPKTYKDSIYRHSTALIENYTSEGSLTIRELRYGEKEQIWGNKN